MNPEKENLELIFAQKTYTVDMTKGYDAEAQGDILLQFVQERFQNDTVLLCGVGTRKKTVTPQKEFFAYTPEEMKLDPIQALVFPAEGSNSFVIVYDATKFLPSTDGRIHAYLPKPETQLEDAVVAILKLQYN